MIEYLVFRVLSLLAPLTPPRVAYWLCKPIGDLTYRLLARRRLTVRRNLSIVLRDRADDLDRRVREVFREGAKNYYDTFRVPALSDAELERLISVDGWPNLDRALQAGRGAIIATAHLGSPILVAQILAVRGHRVTVVVEPVRPQLLLDLMIRVRGNRRMRMIPLGPDVTRELLEALRRNEVLGILMDRDVQKTGVQVRFFGVETTLPGGPAMLALRTGAALMPAFTYRCQGGRFAGYIGEPLELVRTGSLREDVRLNTQKLAQELEKGIERSPEQWTVFEPIWTDRGARMRVGVAD